MLPSQTVIQSLTLTLAHTHTNISLVQFSKATGHLHIMNIEHTQNTYNVIRQISIAYIILEQHDNQ